MPIRFRLSALNNWTSVFLTAVERGGNALPHPGTLFAILAGVIIVVSGIAARTGLEAIHPGTGETIQPISLLTVAGLHRILVEMGSTAPGVPDGMKVDTAGNVWCTGSGGVWIVSPAGERLGVLETPEVTRNICFGGNDMRTLFLTSGASLYSIRVTTPGIAAF